jgi:outer membrane lipoprotein-sorting protein
MKKAITGIFLSLFLATMAFAQDGREVVDKINTASAGINSLVFDVQLTIKRRALTHSLTGKLYFEKEKNFRIVNKNVTDGRFMSDIGSNANYFWFYGKRINPNEMYYCAYDKVGNSHLKDSLNPLLMTEIVGLQSLQGDVVKQKSGNLAVVREVQGSRRNKMILATLIDPQKPAVVGYYLYSLSHNMIAEVTISDFFKTSTNAYLPKSIHVRWASEDVTMAFRLSNPQMNKRIDPKTWEMPNLGVPSVDLGSGQTVRNIND